MLTTLKKLVGRGLRRVLRSRGYTMVKMAAARPEDTMDGAIAGLAKRGHVFGTVIDVGASNGSWTRSFMQHFPNCQYLLVEAQPVHEPALVRFSGEFRNVQFALAAAAEAPGTLFFDASDPLGGQASYTPYKANNIEVPVITIDGEVRTRALAGPYLIKLDTHGFELPILRGAVKTLRETDAIIVECYNFRLTPDSLLFFEMCNYLKEQGFRCIDLVDSMHRPHDGAFWQMDLVFVRDSRPEFSWTEYA